MWAGCHLDTQGPGLAAVYNSLSPEAFGVLGWRQTQARDWRRQGIGKAGALV